MNHKPEKHMQSDLFETFTLKGLGRYYKWTVVKIIATNINISDQDPVKHNSSVSGNRTYNFGNEICGAVLSILYGFFQLILSTNLSSKEFCLYYPDEETEDNRH